MGYYSPMERIKQYFTTERRMGRKAFWVALILYSFASVTVMLLVQNATVPQQEIVDLMIQQKQGDITPAVFEERMNALLGEVQENLKPWRPWIKISDVALIIAFIPAIAMRLRDIGRAPHASLLFLLAPTLKLLGSLSEGGSGALFTVLAALTICAPLLLILLALMPGTRGSNAYGPEPLAR